MTATTSLDTYTALLQDELGLEVDDRTLHADLDCVPEWDSLLLLKLVVLLERATGRQVAVSDLLQARSLAAIYDIAVRP